MNYQNPTFWKKILFSLVLLANFTILVPVFAQDATQPVPPPIIPIGTNQKVLLPHNTSTDSQKNYLNNRLLPGIASTIIAISGGLSLVFVIIAGIFLLTSFGQPEQAETAKKTITYAIAGIVISGLSYAIVALIASINIPK